jgi:hypothetical protein
MSLNLDKSAWKRVAFGDVIENVTDRVDNPSEADVDRYVGLEHLDPGVMIVQRWDTPDKVEAQKLRFQSGDVIFGRRRAYQKKVALAEFEGICSAHALVLRARPDYVHPDYLPVFLSSDYFLDRAIAISVGSLSPTVNWRDLKVQEFDLPPLDEQKRIADLLWSVERFRCDHAELVRRVDVACAALLDQSLRDYGLEKTLGEVVAGIVDCAHQTAPTDEVDFARVIGTPDIRDGKIKLESARPVSMDTYSAWTERAVPTAGDLIFTREAPAGEVGIVPPGARVCLGQRTVLIQPMQEGDGFLVWAVLRSNAVQSLVRLKSAGSTVPHLNVGDIRSLPVLWPANRGAQQRVREIVAAREKAEDALRVDAAALASLRCSLLSNVSGES